MGEGEVLEFVGEAEDLPVVEACLRCDICAVTGLWFLEKTELGAEGMKLIGLCLCAAVALAVGEDLCLAWFGLLLLLLSAFFWSCFSLYLAEFAMVWSPFRAEGISRGGGGSRGRLRS